MKKVVLVTEYLNPPYDEGIKKTVYNLFLDLDSRYELLVICGFGFKKKNVHILQTNRLLISVKINKLINNFNPDSLIYFPFASATFASYLRFKVLNLYNNNRSSFLIALQPKSLSNWQLNLLIKFMKPKTALTPSPVVKSFWDLNHIDGHLLPLITDLNIFKPKANDKSKEELRIKYNLPINSFIISHMGHLNEGRNLSSLIPLQKAGYQIVVVGSSSTPLDSLGPASIKEDLQNEGVIIIDYYIENIEEVYQLSDIYIFPVTSETGSIGMPLSIMEARGCGIPVITTDFGSLQHYFGDDNKSIWYCKPKDFLNIVKEVQTTLPHSFIQTKVGSINQNFYSIIHSVIKGS